MMDIFYSCIFLCDNKVTRLCAINSVYIMFPLLLYSFIYLFIHLMCACVCMCIFATMRVCVSVCVFVCARVHVPVCLCGSVCAVCAEGVVYTF